MTFLAEKIIKSFIATLAHNLGQEQTYRVLLNHQNVSEATNTLLNIHNFLPNSPHRTELWNADISEPN